MDEDIDEFKGKSHEEMEEILAEREAKANAQLLEMVSLNIIYLFPNGFFSTYVMSLITLATSLFHA